MASWFDNPTGAAAADAPPDWHGFVQGTGDDRISYEDAYNSLGYALTQYNGPQAATPQAVNALLNQLGVHYGSEFSARYLQGIFQNLYNNAVQRQADYTAAHPDGATTTTPAATTTAGGARGDVQTDHGTLSGADADRIDAMLKNAGSTDDANYWYGIAAQQGGVDKTGVDWLTGRINQGDGAAGVRNGSVQKFSDGGVNQPFSYAAPDVPSYTFSPFTAPTAEDAANAPGFKATVDTANQGLLRQRASLGSLLTGGTLQDLSTLDAGLGSQNYQNVFNNAASSNAMNNAGYLQQHGVALSDYEQGLQNSLGIYGTNQAVNQQSFNNAFNVGQAGFGNYLSLAGLGLNAAMGGNAAGGAYGSAAGNFFTGIGNANAAGTVGGANALGGALGNLGNYGLIFGSLYGNGRNSTRPTTDPNFPG